jgi:ADP-ribose pyrophosphatase
MLKRLKSETLYRGRVIDLVVDEIEYPSGATGVREVARHPGGAVAVPLFDDGTVMLISQFRYPLNRRIIELPAGKLDKTEDPLSCARRELEEETGWEAREWTKLGSIYTTPGFSDEVLHLFMARDLAEAPGGHRRTEGESGIEIFMLPLQEALRRIEEGEINDAKTICGLLMAAKRERNPG